MRLRPERNIVMCNLCLKYQGVFEYCGTIMQFVFWCLEGLTQSFQIFL